ncbi:MAG TPA: type II toxin-antitoxin system VapC family toxin [Prolixibacteraceae bacterium]|nr:type II toxin-antitoxin system VapC family toxin [Prolixibacteraceae bacterium]
MIGNKAILDSNVIIDAVRNLIDIERSIFQFGQVYISLITYIEVLGYNFKDESEKLLTSQILGMFEIINPDIEIADLTISYLKMKKIKVPDAIILATAKKLNAILLTSNIADFKNIDAEVIIDQSVKY